MTTTEETTGLNQVHLRGRVSSQPEQRQLPSGDRLVTVRIVVPRAPNRVRTSVKVDTLDCVAWTTRAGDALLKLSPQDHVEIEGAVRRRFWRGAAGAMSRVEIEVSRVRRLPRPR